MSDLLSPILVVMDNEVEAFWCFVGFMEKLVSHNKSNLNLVVYFIHLFIAFFPLILTNYGPRLSLVNCLFQLKMIGQWPKSNCL